MRTCSGPRSRIKDIGRVSIGLGLMLLSLHLLEAAALPLRSAPAFVAVLEGLQNEYVMGVLVAAAATWFIHSSLSTVLLVMSFASSGIIDPKLGMAMVIGANIGGAIAPYFDQAATDTEARRLPLGIHLSQFRWLARGKSSTLRVKSTRWRHGLKREIQG